MAKKIRLDFSKTEERSGYNTRHMDEGIYKMKITDVKHTEAGDGTAMLVFSIVPADSQYKTRCFPYYCKLQQNQLWKLRDLLVAAGQDVPLRALNIDPSVVVGKLIAIELEDDLYEGNLRSAISGTYGLAIIEDGDDAGSDDAEGDDGEEEEYEQDEEAEEEAEEEEADEEDDGFDDMSVVALRKLAKAEDIDTAGLSKPELISALRQEWDEEEEPEDEEEDEEELEEEEDLDEEELGEEEEEEEEPAPPTRRKPAAKVAPEAPKRRVVRR